MTINRATGLRKPTESVDTFTGKAPGASREGVIRGKKEQIAVTIAPDLLAKVDAMAGRLRQGPVAHINLAICRLTEQGDS